MALLVSTPQLAVPFDMGLDGLVATVEQDSPQDRLQNAVAVLRYERGQRTALPDFGLPDQALRENGASFNEIVAAVRTWEPDVTVELISQAFDQETQTMEVGMSTPGDANG